MNSTIRLPVDWRTTTLLTWLLVSAAGPDPARSAYAQSAKGGDTASLRREHIVSKVKQRLPAFLAKNYYLVKVTKSYPSSQHRLALQSKGVGYGLGYTFVVRQQYLVSMIAGFHSLYDLDGEQNFGYFTIYNESLRLFRLYHPLYLTLGGRLGYMIPTESTAIPLEQNKSFENEVMLGASLGLYYVLTKKLLVGGGVAFWGGSNSSKHRVVDATLTLRFRI